MRKPTERQAKVLQAAAASQRGYITKAQMTGAPQLKRAMEQCEHHGWLTYDGGNYSLTERGADAIGCGVPDCIATAHGFVTNL